MLAAGALGVEVGHGGALESGDGNGGTATGADKKRGPEALLLDALVAPRRCDQ